MLSPQVLTFTTEKIAVSTPSVIPSAKGLNNTDAVSSPTAKLT